MKDTMPVARNLEKAKHKKPCNRFSQSIIHLAISGLAEEDYVKETLKGLSIQNPAIASLNLSYI